jgi:hypothetical protein
MYGVSILVSFTGFDGNRLMANRADQKRWVKVKKYS